MMLGLTNVGLWGGMFDCCNFLYKYYINENKKIKK